jgi:hypothetical protein
VVGGGTAGGFGGFVTVIGKGITFGGDVNAKGSAGGNVSPMAKTGSGGNGRIQGGTGGALAAAGDGGFGGEITIVDKGILHISKAFTINANGGNGGNQLGATGNGGDAATNVDGSKGGNGGDILPEGAGLGGDGGMISITPKPKPSDINVTEADGASGTRNGTFGHGGKGKAANGRDGMYLEDKPSE